MRPDVAKQRFEELEKRATEIAATREAGERCPDGSFKYHVARPAFMEWGTGVLDLLQQSCGEQSVYFREFKLRYEKFHGRESRFQEAKAIFDAARDAYFKGYLPNLTEVVHASVFSDYLSAADYLNGEGYKDPAAVIAGSTLEQHLRALCQKQGVAVLDANGKPKKADLINAELCKANAYSGTEQKQVTAWLSIRNHEAHGHYSEYTKEQAALLIQGVRDFVTRHPA